MNSSARTTLFVAMVLAIGGCSNSNDSLTPGVGSKSTTGTTGTSDQSKTLDQTKAASSTGTPVSYTVPSTGGMVSVMGKSGMQIDFKVPASASGKQLTFTPTTAASIGWDDHNFAEVIKMEPDGTHFAEPIVVRPANKALIVMDFSSSSTKSAPEALALNSTKDGFLLNHFSTLVVFSPDYNCESQNGWVAGDSTTEAATCTDPAFPHMLVLNCLTHPYCLQIDASCCAADGETACDLTSPSLSLSYSRADESSTDYAYCIAQETATTTTTSSSSVCTQYTVEDCTCDNGSSGTHSCLKDESGWTDCVCSGDTSSTASADALCPDWHNANCTVTDANSCSCRTSDTSHTYTIGCNADSGCNCWMDETEIGSFAFEDQVCATTDSIVERWFTHCAGGACP